MRQLGLRSLQLVARPSQPPCHLVARPALQRWYSTRWRVVDGYRVADITGLPSLSEVLASIGSVDLLQSPVARAALRLIPLLGFRLQ